MGIGAQRIAQQQRARHRLDQRRLLALDDAPHRQRLMPAIDAAVGRLAEQHLLDIARAEQLAGTEHGGQEFLRDRRRIDRIGGPQAIVAIAAVFDEVFAEMFQQDATPAARRLDQRSQRRQPRPLAGLPLRLDLADPLARTREILRAPEQMRDCWIAVAARAAGFLIIGLDRFRQAGMRDEADVGLVDAHAECDRRADHHVFARDEIRLVFRADMLLQPRMIGAGRPAGAGERLRQFFRCRARLRIDDAGAGRACDDVGDLLGRVRLGADRIADIGPVEARHDQPILRNAELREDIGAGMRVRRRGQRQPRHVREGIHQRREQAIIGAEIVPPFADAMRLVDREQAELRAAQQFAEMPG